MINDSRLDIHFLSTFVTSSFPQLPEIRPHRHGGHGAADSAVTEQHKEHPGTELAVLSLDPKQGGGNQHGEVDVLQARLNAQCRGLQVTGTGRRLGWSDFVVRPSLPSGCLSLRSSRRCAPCRLV